MAKDTLTLTKAVIVVAANPHMDTGIYADFNVHGILPRGRKPKHLIATPMANSIWVKPLFGYHGEANVRPEDWRALILAAPIVVDRFSPVTLTPEIEKFARDRCASICDCPAVTNSEYRPSYTPVVVAS